MAEWIKLHRGLLDSYAFANPVSLKVWLWILLKTNYKTTFIPIKVGKGAITVKVERGQFIYGRFRAEEELSLDGSMVYRLLKKFEELGQIKIDSNNQYSLITVCNFDSYQSKNENFEKQKENERKTNEKQTENEWKANESDMNQIRIRHEHSIEGLESIESIEEIEIKSKIFEEKNQEDMIVLEMIRVWKIYNPKYLEDKENDYTSCLQMAYKIARVKGWKESDVINFKKLDTVSSWEKIMAFVAHDNFLKKFPLKTLNNNFQMVVQKIQVEKNLQKDVTETKQVIPEMSEEEKLKAMVNWANNQNDN